MSLSYISLRDLQANGLQNERALLKLKIEDMDLGCSLRHLCPFSLFASCLLLHEAPRVPLLLSQTMAGVPATGA